jgi:hypothetical protein
MSANAGMPVGAAEYATSPMAASCRSLPRAAPAASGMIELPAP